ncbi:response regulator [bacterium]|nr:response regulator [bacterium]MBU1152899.1 response regulator [bacterium]MBU1782496.1 response regulator [bacterium]
MKKILIIDDDPDIVGVLKLLLEIAHYQVIETFNGKEGLERADKDQPDLILLDIMMPVMDGWEVCKKLKGCLKTSPIPVIILTAKSEEENEKRAKKEGVVDYLTKPFLPLSLLKKIEKAIIPNCTQDAQAK